MNDELVAGFRQRAEAAEAERDRWKKAALRLKESHRDYYSIALSRYRALVIDNRRFKELHAEQNRLQTALKPSAVVEASLSPSREDDKEIAVEVTVGDVRRARDALSAQPAPDPKDAVGRDLEILRARADQLKVDLADSSAQIQMDAETIQALQAERDRLSWEIEQRIITSSRVAEQRDNAMEQCEQLRARAEAAEAKLASCEELRQVALRRLEDSEVRGNRLEAERDQLAKLVEAAEGALRGYFDRCQREHQREPERIDPTGLACPCCRAARAALSGQGSGEKERGGCEVGGCHLRTASECRDDQCGHWKERGE